jgi:NAD(P)-dependent dehydrogenase (short-subunit alcohol dehydrogenase family)
MGRLEGKSCVVTGVGVGGIGWTTVELMVEEGASVVFGDVNTSAGELLAKQLTSSGAQVLFVPTDLEEPEAVKRLCDSAISEFGGIDVLFNGAADQRSAESGEDSDAVSIPIEVWDHVMRVNLRSVFLTCKYSVPSMISRGGGAIINTASTAGIVGEAARAAYGTSKAGVITFTRYVACAYGHQGIRANSIAPALVSRYANGPEETEDSELDIGSGRPKSIKSAEFLRAQASQSLTGKMGSPRDVAEVVLFLANEQSQHVTGETIRVDGGVLSGVPWDRVKVHSRS